MLDLFGTFIGGFIKFVIKLIIGSIFILPFVLAGAIGLYGIVTGNGVIMLAAVIGLLVVIMIGGGLAARLHGGLHSAYTR